MFHWCDSFLQAMANLAEYLKNKNAHIGGIGVQSHLKKLPMDEEALEVWITSLLTLWFSLLVSYKIIFNENKNRFQKRMQIVGRVGLPITVSEFSVHTTNVQLRADTLDMAFRVYFANPNVHAIILWGFADQFYTFANDFYLTQGTNFTVSHPSLITCYTHV